LDGGPDGELCLGNFLGAGLADQLLKTMRSEGNYSTLNFVIRDMIAGGTFGGVEVGFISENRDGYC
jgi:hypothetical protein